MKTKYDIVYVEWVDSEESSGWQTISDVKPGLCICKSVGYLIIEATDYIAISSHLAFDNDRDCCGLMKIPQCAIKKLKRLDSI